MADWNELFYDEKNRELAPEAELFRFVSLLEKTFSERPLSIWDLGCGAGRHTVAIARSGHRTYASDVAPKAIELTREWLSKTGAEANLQLAEMTHFPWQDDIKFHGVFSWAVLQHNTLDNIFRVINLIHSKLLPGGMLLATVISDKADGFGNGSEIEPKTFVLDKGKEAGVPHHYFDEKGIRELFCKDKWNIKALVEQVITNAERPEGFWEYTPFRSTCWGVLMQKRYY